MRRPAAARRSRPGATRRGRDPRLPAPGRRRRRALPHAAVPHGAAATAWAPAGYEIGWAQVAAGRTAAGPRGPRAAPHQGWTGDVALDDEGVLLHPAFAAPPALSLWRAPTDNDRIGGMAARWAAWGLPSLDAPARRDRAGGRRRHRPRDLDDAPRASRSLTRSGSPPRRRRPDPRRGAVDVPAELDDLPRVGTVLELAAGSRGVRVVRARAARDVPGPGAGRAGRALARRPSPTSSSPYVRPQENGGHADIRWLGLGGAGRRRSASTSTGRGQVSATHSTAADLDAATHDVELRPRPRPSSTSTPPTGARHRELRPGHARAVRHRAAAPTAGPGPCGRGRRRVTIHWDAAAREWHLENGRAAGRCGSSRTAGSGTSTPAPRCARALVRHLGPAPFAGFTNRVGEPVALEVPVPGVGDFRVPALVVEGPDGSTVLDLRYADAPHRAPASRRSRASRRPTPRRATRRRRWRSTSSTRRPAARHRPHHAVRGPPGRRPRR